MGLLDLYYNVGTQLNQIYNDYSTAYPSTNTGTPTNTQNPGGPVDTFHQNYDEYDKYLDTNDLYSGELKNILDITNYDVENPSVQGGPLNDTTTQYPATVTGTPNAFANPGGPPTNFSPPNDPNSTFLNNYFQSHNRLYNTLYTTNLDVEHPGVQGGPNGDGTTSYPSTVTGTPTSFANPGGPLTWFYPNYTPQFQYIYNVPNGGDGELRYTLNITNLDVQNPGVSGGPARPVDDPTIYPQYVSGVPNNTQNPGGPVRKFKQNYKPNKEYVNNIPNNGDGELQYTLDITNLDVDNPSVLGGPVADNTTQYPPFVSGTPTVLFNTLGSGPFINSGAPPYRFGHPYHPHYTYLFNLPNAGSGILANTLAITNFDVENSNVVGGPLNDSTTNYPVYTTGIPTSQSNYSIWNGGSGTSAKRFTQIYSPNNEYLISNPFTSSFLIANSQLISSLEVTNLDIEKQGAFGGPNTDITTQYYQAPLTTGTPTSQSNFNLTSPFASGVAPKPFTHPWSNTSTYLNSNPIAVNNSGQLKNTLAVTNFDVEDPSVLGGPLNDTSTVYPAANVTHTSQIRGWFAEPSQPPSRFNHTFTPTNTYESFIQAYV
tara:strand:- start:473 stop:2269 length:1797 start_codon:yes stop_codon:yes gene_type:complete